jgi:hypothetical protein
MNTSGSLNITNDFLVGSNGGRGTSTSMLERSMPARPAAGFSSARRKGEPSAVMAHSI